VLDATLPSPNDIEWDYWRIRSAGGRPARNRVALAIDAGESETVYDYVESFSDPASPLAFARILGKAAKRGEGAFASAFRKALGPAAPRKADIEQVYRERFASPIVREVARIATRRDSGRWQLRRVQGLVELADRLSNELAEALVPLAPVTELEKVKSAVDAGLKPLGDEVEKQSEGRDALAWATGDARIHFRVTLVMPAPIVRANSCFQGDTVTWEFDQEDLYGPGFEMWARALRQ
jgi:hypothetical protein